ncbi:MAG: hypothetical protein JWM48_3362 [Mycobacterium sp.]|nr:hypothetical protein [Mycobacterium sp.]
MVWDSLRHPRGRQAAAVYWRRRLGVLVVAVVLLVLVVSLLSGLLGGGRSNPATVAVGGSPSPTPSLQAPTVPAAASAGVSPSPTGPPAACRAADLTVAVATDARSYDSSSVPRFTITVTNRGAQPCLVDLGSPGRAVVVTSGKDRIWGSIDCIAPNPAATQVAPGQTVTSTTVWSRRRSSGADCAGTGAPVPSGTFTAVASAGGVTSAPASFTLL